jgi:hypothetical protein
MVRILLGIFIILHGLVHLLYFGQSARRFELRPEMQWPDGSWAFSRVFGDKTTRNIASIACVLAAVGLIVSGIGLFVNQTWGRTMLMASAGFSSLIILLFWDGKFSKLDDQGGVGLLINLAIMAAMQILEWPI